MNHLSFMYYFIYLKSTKYLESAKNYIKHHGVHKCLDMLLAIGNVHASTENRPNTGEQ